MVKGRHPANAPSHWTDEEMRVMRIRRAMHELMAGPAYTTRIDGNGVLIVGPQELMTPEAREFIGRYRKELLHAGRMMGWDQEKAPAKPVEQGFLV